MTSPAKSKDLLKVKIKKSHLTPAHFSINGVIQIQGGPNIHLGHNLTVGQTTEKPLRPEEPSINPHALERLKAFDEEVNQRHRTLVARHIGSDWRYLGRELAGFSNAQMDHLEENFKAGKYTFHEMVYQLLLKWKTRRRARRRWASWRGP